MSLFVAEPSVSAPDSPADWSDILHLTELLFPGTVSMERMSDPDSPQQAWVVLTVHAQGDSQQLLRRRCEWHERVALQFPEQVCGLRLSICPVP